MKLFVGKRPIPIRGALSEDEVQRLVSKARRPFVVKTASGKNFTSLARVFLTTEAGARVECEDEHELRFACRLLAEESGLCRDDSNFECIRETESMERATAEFMNDPAESSDDEPREEEDISIEEWGQLGYKWFKYEEVHYI
jgi:hypothetical protein